MRLKIFIYLVAPHACESGVAAPLCHRTARHFATNGAVEERASVLECSSPLAL
jgi:hypothetical protein